MTVILETPESVAIALLARSKELEWVRPETTNRAFLYSVDGKEDLGSSFGEVLPTEICETTFGAVAVDSRKVRDPIV